MDRSSSDWSPSMDIYPGSFNEVTKYAMHDIECREWSRISIPYSLRFTYWFNSESVNRYSEDTASTLYSTYSHRAQ